MRTFFLIVGAMVSSVIGGFAAVVLGMYLVFWVESAFYRIRFHEEERASRKRLGRV